jgi:hypothetical protein
MGNETKILNIMLIFIIAAICFYLLCKDSLFIVKTPSAGDEYMSNLINLKNKITRPFRKSVVQYNEPRHRTIQQYESFTSETQDDVENDEGDDVEDDVEDEVDDDVEDEVEDDVEDEVDDDVEDDVEDGDDQEGEVGTVQENDEDQSKDSYDIPEKLSEPFDSQLDASTEVYSNSSSDDGSENEQVNDSSDDDMGDVMSDDQHDVSDFQDNIRNSENEEDNNKLLGHEPYGNIKYLDGNEMGNNNILTGPTDDNLEELQLKQNIVNAHERVKKNAISQMKNYGDLISPINVDDNLYNIKKYLQKQVMNGEYYCGDEEQTRDEILLSPDEYRENQLLFGEKINGTSKEPVDVVDRINKINNSGGYIGNGMLVSDVYDELTRGERSGGFINGTNVKGPRKCVMKPEVDMGSGIPNHYYMNKKNGKYFIPDNWHYRNEKPMNGGPLYGDLYGKDPLLMNNMVLDPDIA